MKLAEKLIEVMKSVDNVPKNGWNEFHRYAFAQEVDILRAVRGKLAELGVLMLVSIEGASRQGDLTEVITLHTFLDAESGEKIEVKGYGQGLDKTDKGGPKAITSSVKYAITKNLLIPTGDDPENDDQPPPKAPKGNGQANQAPKPATTPPPRNAPPAPPNGPTRSPNASTPHQQSQIQKLAGEMGLDVNRDILDRLGLKWPPTKQDAERIINRLHEKKREAIQ